MHHLKTLTAAVAFAALNLTAPIAMAHEHEEHDFEHRSEASQGGGTPGNQGIGGSVDVPHAEGGAEQTTPYDDLGTTDDDENTGDRSND